MLIDVAGVPCLNTALVEPAILLRCASRRHWQLEMLRTCSMPALMTMMNFDQSVAAYRVNKPLKPLPH